LEVGYPLESGKKALVTAVSIKMRAEIVVFGRDEMRGILHSLYLDKPFVFYDLMRMIEKMEWIFDSKGFPEAFLSPRSFGKVKSKRIRPETESSGTMNDVINQLNNKESGSSRCTFEISVRFRQNATWQGQIFWVEKNQVQNFRSVLEMLKLMDEALMDGSEKSEQIEWKDGTSTF